MKTIIQFAIWLVLFGIGYFPAYTQQNLKYSNWINLGTTMVQIRYAPTSTEGINSNYKVQVRINKDNPNYKENISDAKLSGYYVALGPTIMSIDSKSNNQYISLKIDKHFAGVFTLENEFSIVNDSKRISYKLKDDAFYLIANDAPNGIYRGHEPFLHCFDWWQPGTIGTQWENKCNGDKYQKDKVIELK